MNTGCYLKIEATNFLTMASWAIWPSDNDATSFLF